MSARGTWNTAQGIRNSSYYLNLESITWNPEFKTVLDFLACGGNSVLGTPNDFFFSVHTVRRSKYCLEVSNVREKLSISGY